MEPKLIRREEVRVSSWINNQPISTPEWEVYSQEETADDTIILVLVDQRTNNRLRLEMKKYIQGQK